MFKIDLNSDIGESFGAYSMGNDKEVLSYVTSANIACGYHAGDPLVMERTLLLAKTNGVAVGAHPGYPDLQGFGRRNMKCSSAEIKAFVKYQLGAMIAMAGAYGLHVQHCKPHGALYNTAAKDYSVAMAIVDAIYEVDRNIILVGLCGSELIRAGEDKGIKTVGEAFADRTYQKDGTLLPRSIKGAVIHDTDKAVGQVLDIVKEGRVCTVTGEYIDISAESICVHGDTPEAVDFVCLIRKKLEAEGCAIVPMSQII